MTTTANLHDFFQPGEPLPSDTVMIAKALDVLQHSPHGQQLANFAEKKDIHIRIIATPDPVTYIPDRKLVYVGFNRNNPIPPSRFILMLVGALREAQQEAAGIKHPPLEAPLSEHKKISLSKQEDKLWYMCTVAKELNDQASFSRYKFLDELRKMGHNESLDLYLKQVQKS